MKDLREEANDKFRLTLVDPNIPSETLPWTFTSEEFIWKHRPNLHLVYGYDDVPNIHSKENEEDLLQEVESTFNCCTLTSKEMQFVIQRCFGRIVSIEALGFFAAIYQYDKWAIPLECPVYLLTDLNCKNGESLIEYYYTLDNYNGIISLLRDCFDCNHPQMMQSQMAMEFEKIIKTGHKIVENPKGVGEQLTLNLA